MDAQALLAVGMSGGYVRVNVDDDDAGGAVVARGSDEIALTGSPAALFKALLGAAVPLDKAQIKARIWNTQEVADETVYNVISSLRRALKTLFADPVVATGRPARYALNIGLPKGEPAPVKPRRWPARLIVCANQALCRGIAAALSLQSIEANPGAGLVLGTGRTAGEVFHAAIALAGKRHFRGLEAARYFTDMETLGVGPRHATSRQAFVRKALIEPLRAAGYRIGEDRFTFFPGFIENEASHFENVLPVLRTTPLAAHVVSVSPLGGVIGYSAGEVSRSLDDIVVDDCKVMIMSEAERRYMDDRLPSPSMLTIGLLNLLRADSLVVPIYHETKVRILGIMLGTDPDPAIPATLLKLHRKATVITTTALAGDIGDEEHAIMIGSARDIETKLGLLSA